MRCSPRYSHIISTSPSKFHSGQRARWWARQRGWAGQRHGRAARRGGVTAPVCAAPPAFRTVVRADGTVVRQLVQHVQLLDRDLVNLVNDVDAADIHATALNHVNQLVHLCTTTEAVGVRGGGAPRAPGCEAPPPPPRSWTACAYVAVGLEVHVCVVNAVLGQHGLDGCKKGQEGECKLAQVRRRARAVRSCCSPPQTLGRGAPSRSSLGFCTVDVKLMPPLSFFRNVISGGFLFSRMPKPASHTAKCVRVQPRGRLQPRPAAPLRAAGSPSLTLTLKLVLDQLLVRQRLEAVQHD